MGPGRLCVCVCIDRISELNSYCENRTIVCTKYHAVYTCITNVALFTMKYITHVTVSYGFWIVSS